MAKTKAQSMASGLGITLGEVQSVSENSYYYTPNYRSYDMMAVGASEAKAETPVSPSDVSVSATVNVVYELN